MIVVLYKIDSKLIWNTLHIMKPSAICILIETENYEFMFLEIFLYFKIIISNKKIYCYSYCNILAIGFNI